MNATEVSAAIARSVAGRWGETNAHSVDLRRALLNPPQRVEVRESYHDGKAWAERVGSVWLVLIESPGDGTGYRIIAEEDPSEPNGLVFGLAIKERDATDPRLCHIGLYGDFWTTLQGM